MISNFEAKYYVVSVLYNFLKLHIPIGFCSTAYTLCPEKTPPKHVKTTLGVENGSHYFTPCHEKPSISNVCVKFHDN